jgi:hypothetical protein
MTHAGTTRLVGMERQALHDAIQRFNTKGHYRCDRSTAG